MDCVCGDKTDLCEGSNRKPDNDGASSLKQNTADQLTLVDLLTNGIHQETGDSRKMNTVKYK